MGSSRTRWKATSTRTTTRGTRSDLMAEEENAWTMSAHEVDGQKRIYRVRSALPAVMKPADFPECVIIEWNYGSGLPNEELSELQSTFEEFMDPLDDPAKNSLLMHVYTGSGIKEWCYYARNYEQYMADLNKEL